MSEVTVRVVGTSPGSSNVPGGASSLPGGGGTGAGTSIDPTVARGQNTLPPDNRLVEDIRRAIMTHGAVYVPTNNTYKPILNQVEQEQRRNIDSQVSEKYEAKRWEIYAQRDAAGEELLKQGKSDEEINRALKPFDVQLDAIDKAETREKQEKQDELTKALEELTDVINRTGSINPDSYLGQLRQQRQEAIFERDTAEDEETARAAAQRVKDIDQKIKEVEGGAQKPKDIDFGDRVLATIMGFDQLTKGIAGKNLGSMIMGAGQTFTAMTGMSDETAAKTLAWLAPIATIGTLLTQEGQKSDQMAGLAALIRGTESIGDTRANMYSNLWNYSPFGLGSIYAMGMSVPEFAESAEKRISQRGMVENGVLESFYQEALERVFSLNRGSLGEAGKYDRYGLNATNAIVDLVSQLERISNSGVTQGNYARVQEYLGMQQDLMSNYMRFVDKPSATIANRDIAAFANIDNYTVDSRTAGDIKSVQNLILNPQNDRLKAILYGVVEENFTEYKGQSTRGRVDLIDQLLHDPQYQGAIEKALMQQLTAMYGGADTPLGYLMIQSLLPGIESPERRKAIWEAMIQGTTGEIMSGATVATGEYRESEKQEYVKQVKSYVAETTEKLVEMSDAIFNGVSYIEKIARNVEKMTNGESILKLF